VLAVPLRRQCGCVALEASKDARCAAAAVEQGMGKLPAVAAAPSCSDKLDRHSLPIILLFGPNQICRICIHWDASHVGRVKAVHVHVHQNASYSGYFKLVFFPYLVTP
jgi:hypothetical protein